MNTYEKLGICAVASLMGHFGLARALDQLPPHVDPPQPRVVEIKFTQPPPEPPAEPEKPKPPEPKAPDPPFMSARSHAWEKAIWPRGARCS